MTNINDTLNADQKLAKVLLILRKIKPFYACIYEVMEKKQQPGLGTLGVGLNVLVYDPEYVEKVTLEELLYGILHEIVHAGLKHVARRETKDNTLWNIACDLYVNSVLADEFGVNSPGIKVTTNNYEIKAPIDILFCSSINIDKDFAEDIYNKLENQAKSNGYTKSQLSKNNQQKSHQFIYSGSDYNESSINPYKTFSIELTNDNFGHDLIDGGEDQAIKNQESQKIITNAVVRSSMLYKSMGSENGTLQVMVEGLLKSEIDWRKILRKYLIITTSKDSSFAKPDKRMYYQRAIYPGQIADDMIEIKGVKVCIDVSASISDEDLQYFYGQVYDLLNKFKVQAELVYWDSKVQSVGDFTKYSEFTKIDCSGRGGTNPEVIFEYFESKKCKIKPIVTLILTDAYFYTDWVTAKISKKYKDTVWILTKESKKDFKAPFGIKAKVRFK